MSIYYLITEVIFVYVMVIICHELGHIIYVTIALKKPFEIKRNGLNIEIITTNITPRQSIKMDLSGVVFGLYPILLFTGTGNPEGYLQWIYFSLLIPYLWGCRDDFKAMEKQMKVIQNAKQK